MSYANEVKENILGVSPSTLYTYGAVSAQVAEQMAQGVANILNTDCAIAVTGIAGPNGGSAEKPVGTTYISTKLGDNITTVKYQFGTSRQENINRATNMAILQLIKMLTIK